MMMTDRAHLQEEINQLINEIDNIADSTTFNDIQLLDGSKLMLHSKSVQLDTND